MRLIEVDQDSTPDCISPARLLRRVFLDTSYLILATFSTTSSLIFLSQKNNCDIYEKGVTNTSKNSSVNFLQSISTEKID